MHTAALTDPQNTVPLCWAKVAYDDLIDLPRIGTGVTMPQMQLKRAVRRIVRNTAPGFILDGITTVTNVAKSSRLHNLTETLNRILVSKI